MTPSVASMSGYGVGLPVAQSIAGLVLGKQGVAQVLVRTLVE